jgi:hypothetical protein
MDTATIDSFFDEIEKISQEAAPVQAQPVPDNLITKDRFKRFLGAAGAGALGAGIGYGAGHLVGAPIENKLVEWGIRKGPAKVLRYALPTAAGLGAALSLARLNLRNELFKKVKGEDGRRNIGTDQQPSQLG